MAIKRNSPFRKTFIAGYSYPYAVGYIPSALGYQNGGYESDNSTFAPATTVWLEADGRLICAPAGQLTQL